MDGHSSNSSGIDIDIKGLTKFKAFADRMAALNVLSEEQLSHCTRVSVDGYDTSLPVDTIKSALRDHFMSCGQVWSVVIPQDPINPCVVERCGFIYFKEEGAQEKALALNGIDVKGWNVVVKALPKKVCEFSTEQVDSARRLVHTRQERLSVTGYDTSRPADVVRSELFRHFSSCGEIIYLTVDEDRRQPKGLLQKWSFICISGEGALDKAKALSGTDLGGWTVTVWTLPEEFGKKVYPAEWNSISVE